MFGLLKGLSVTISQLPKKKYTLMYPEVKPQWPDRFRGVHKFYPELCIVCNQCARICPTSCISLSGSRGEDRKLHIETYDINFEICILCDLCTEVCPTEAIQMTDTFELAEYSRDALYKNIEWLTENGRQHDARKGLKTGETDKTTTEHAEVKAAGEGAAAKGGPGAVATAGKADASKQAVGKSETAEQGGSGTPEQAAEGTAVTEKAGGK